MTSGFNSSMVSALLLVAILVLDPNPIGAQNIGVCYGMFGSDLPMAQDTVNLYKSYGISKMRIYSPHLEVLDALQGSGISLILDTSHDSIKMLSSNGSAATLWVQTFVFPYASVVKYIVIGNFVMPGDSAAQFVLPAMKNVQYALAATRLAGWIKVTTAVNSSVLTNTNPPSSSVFTKSVAGYFTPIIKFLKSNGSPLLASIYPYFSYIKSNGNVTLESALFTASGPIFTDSGNGLQYQNIFDVLMDSFYAALEKSGGHGVRIMPDSGWPSQGSDVATPHNAATYYSNLIRHVANGTPKKPGRPLDTYLFGMFDENTKPGNESERHFGLFTPDQQSKYGISFSSAPNFLGCQCYD